MEFLEAPKGMLGMGLPQRSSKATQLRQAVANRKSDALQAQKPISLYPALPDGVGEHDTYLTSSDYENSNVQELDALAKGKLIATVVQQGLTDCVFCESGRFPCPCRQSTTCQAVLETEVDACDHAFQHCPELEGTPVQFFRPFWDHHSENWISYRCLDVHFVLAKSEQLEKFDSVADGSPVTLEQREFHFVETSVMDLLQDTERSMNQGAGPASFTTLADYTDLPYECPCDDDCCSQRFATLHQMLTSCGAKHPELRGHHVQVVRAIWRVAPGKRDIVLQPDGGLVTIKEKVARSFGRSATNMQCALDTPNGREELQEAITSFRSTKQSDSDVVAIIGLPRTRSECSDKDSVRYWPCPSDGCSEVCCRPGKLVHHMKTEHLQFCQQHTFEFYLTQHDGTNFHVTPSTTQFQHVRNPGPPPKRIRALPSEVSCEPRPVAETPVTRQVDDTVGDSDGGTQILRELQREQFKFMAEEAEKNRQMTLTIVKLALQSKGSSEALSSLQNGLS